MTYYITTPPRQLETYAYRMYHEFVLGPILHFNHNRNHRLREEFWGRGKPLITRGF